MRLLDFTYAALVTTLFAARGVLGIGGANPGFEESQQIQRDQLKRMRDFLGPDSDFLSKRQAPPQTINFSNPAAQQFFVPGTSLPDGTPNITNDDELAAQLVGFLGQFLEVFSELKGKDFFLSGESKFKDVPYIANFIYENPDLLDLNLKGIDIADPSLSYDVVQDEIPALRFAQVSRGFQKLSDLPKHCSMNVSCQAHTDLFPFTQAQWAEFQNISDTCGYTDYLDKFVTYPPAGQLPFPAGVVEGTFGTLKPGCRLHSPIQQAVGVYVQDAIHAPHINWDICSEGSVYVNAAGRPGNDQSVASMLSVFPNVIEKSERVVVVHGLADFILVAEGTRIAIQNMTWNGAQGFQTPIENETFTVKNFGVFGNEHTERGLTCTFIIPFSNVMWSYDSSYVVYVIHTVEIADLPLEFVPWAAYNAISFLLGLQDSPST
ncbi:hypothetical protein HHX47_DHR3000070 [Lentinula edodes]|nr:hypothetical protein HHX47_DHR3000070 [Lentinula edodes]